MDYSVNNNFRNIIKSSVGRQSFFSLPTPLVVITCSYINYIAITYYLELSENPIVTIIYLSTAYSWAFASILLSGRVGFKINSLDIWVGILFIIIAEGYVASLGLNKEFIFKGQKGDNYVTKFNGNIQDKSGNIFLHYYYN